MGKVLDDKASNLPYSQLVQDATNQLKSNVFTGKITLRCIALDTALPCDSHFMLTLKKQGFRHKATFQPAEEE